MTGPRPTIPIVGMRFLQLSDIHFLREVDGALDVDRELRWGLQEALREVNKDGSIDAILVAGDVAFSGARDEYGRAATFLREIALELGVGLEMIFIIPGNHDIDRKQTDNPLQRELRSGLRNHQTATARDDALREIARREPRSELLMAPLTEYVRFAAQYDCPTTAACPCWQCSVLLTQDIELSLHGMNSVLASHEHDHREKEQLVVGTGQAIFQPADGCLHLAMCHHPSEWILDADEIHNRLKKRALVLVTGHTHKYKVIETEAGIWLRAGALQPSRREEGWKPQFSVLEIAWADRDMELTVFPWAWDVKNFEFKPRAPRTVRRAAPSQAITKARREEIETKMAIRRLITRLGLLSSGDVLNAAVEAGLPPVAGTLDDAPGKLAAQAVTSADETDRLGELWEEMTARRNTKMENPFR